MGPQAEPEIVAFAVPVNYILRMTHDDLLTWRQWYGLTQAQAADRLGLTERMFRFYESGSHPIPLKVRLACAAVALGFIDYAGPAKKPTMESLDGKA